MADQKDRLLPSGDGSELQATPKPWGPDSTPTAPDLAEWLRVCNDDERLKFARAAIKNYQAERRCFEQDHTGTVEFWQTEARRLGDDVEAASRELLALWERISADGLLTSDYIEEFRKGLHNARVMYREQAAT